MSLNATLYEDLKNEHSKVAQKVWNDLNREKYWCVLMDENSKAWLFNYNHTTDHVPNYAYYYLKKYIKRNYDLDYWHDILLKGGV